MAYLENVGTRSAAEPETVVRLKKNGYSLPEWWPSLLIGIIALGTWEWLVHTGMLSALFFPAPTVILETLGRWLTDVFNKSISNVELHGLYLTEWMVDSL